MNAQTASEWNVATPICLGRYRLYHYKDGTFWIALARGKEEVPLVGVRAPSSPIKLKTAHERHLLFVRNCSTQKGEAALWDERLIDDIPVRWEILLHEENEGDLNLQMHFLSYGSLQAEVQFLCSFMAESAYNIKKFSCPHASVLLTTPRCAASVITLQPAHPNCLQLEEGGYLVWTLPAANLHQQVLHLRIHPERAADEEHVTVQHIEYRTWLFPTGAEPFPSLKLRASAQSAVALLQNPEWHSHFAEDQVVLRVAPNDRRFSVFTLAAAKALLDWNRFSGDESATWTARLAMNSAMDFQVINTQSNNSGACWDTVDEKRQGCDITGHRRFNLYRNARVLQQTLLLHRDTGSELCVRVALNGISWLLLKRGATGTYDGATVLLDGTVQGGDGKGIMGAIISVMCAAYGLTETEAYMHAANRLAEHLLRHSCLPLSPGSVLPAEIFPALREDVFAAASAIEGLARLYRAYPHEPLREGALRMMQWLRLWQLNTAMEGLESGEVLAGDGTSEGYVDISIEAARGALWAFSLQRDAHWFAYASRALHAAAGYLDPLAGFPNAKLAYPDHVHALAAFTRAYIHWLLSIPATAPGVECDPDLLVCRVGNRIFVPEPSLWRSIRVETRGLVDWVALVCPATHDILLAVLTDGSSGAAKVDAGEHRQMATDLISGSTAAIYPLHTLPGVGSVGVYILQA
ncbi:MAG: hypothetical protein KatS3mg022_0111 [Armatimonadota bacterium]|nr:MAG: hypothetical protein KatS3mg022_0111 [Armatimonadota bacterium]